MPSTLHLTRRDALAGGAVAGLLGTAGCLDRVRDRLHPRTYHSDAVLGDPLEPWPTLGHDARHTGAREAPTELPAEPTVERVGDGGGAFYEEPPAIGEEAVYSALSDQHNGEYGRAFVATERGGDERWRLEWPESKSPAPPTVHGETAFLTRAGTTVAVDRRTGKRRWSYAAGIAPAAPTVVDETVYVIADRGGTLYALEAATGAEQFRTDLGAAVDHRPAVGGDAVYVLGYDDGYALYVVDAAGGDVRRTVPLGNPETSSVDTNNGVSLAGDAVYLTGVRDGRPGVFRVA